jgi:ketosteroid isomerase-like protein
MRSLQWTIVAISAIMAACSPSAPAAAVDKAAEEKAIGDLATKWVDAASKKDVETIVSFYAPDGAVVWPDAPAKRGAAAIREAWVELFKIPGLSLNFVPERIDISDSGDMAADFGRVESELDSASGRVKDVAKYIVVWRKIDGAWKVLYDSFNSNGPAAPAEPTTRPTSS